MNIVIMGPQGSGKSTQADLLAKKLNIPHLSTGDIYRALAEQNSDLGKKVKQILDTGGLIDDETTFRVVDLHLGEITGGFVIEGFPRTLAQAQREIVRIDKVVYLELPDKDAVARLLLRRRPDDTPDLIAQRLKLYHKDTEPILDYYRKQGKLIEVDGRPSIERIFEDICQKLALND